MGEIKAELNAELQTHIAFEIPLFGGIPVPESAVVSWAIIVVLTLLAIWLTHGLRKRPGRKQIAAEMLVGFINNFCRDTLGDQLIPGTIRTPAQIGQRSPAERAFTLVCHSCPHDPFHHTSFLEP